MIVHRSNRLERLVAGLAEVLERPLRRPLAPDPLVVQSRGMAQWVQLELARLHGVAAHLRVLHPRALVEELLAGQESDPEAVRAWTRERLAYTLLTLLPDVLADEAFAPLRAWLGDASGADGVVRRWQLARRIAHVFDQYAVYRVDMVRAWSVGDDAPGRLGPGDAWQPRLWRMLEARLGAHHLAARHERLVGGGLKALAEAGRLPERLVVFGVSTLPPLYLDVLDRLGEHTDVHLFQLSPSREFWAHVQSRRERIRVLRGRDPDFGEEAEAALHLEEGHPLLASLGRVGRDFQYTLECCDYHEPDDDLYEVPDTSTALGVLQADVLSLVTRDDADGPRGRVAVSPDDRSLLVLGCHSPAREIEVLRDALWDLFDADPTLRPRDVTVLLPDVTAYGPLVDAVFGVPSSDPLFLPYTLADRPIAAGNEVARSLLDLLALAGTRLAAPAVVDLLAHGPVRRRFGLGEEALAGVEELVAEAGVRWGRDARHRAEVGQPEVDTHTWRFGLDRLLLGHALADELPFEGRVPFADVEGEAAEIVGRLADFVHELFVALDDLSVSRPVVEQLERVAALVERWFGGEDDAALRPVREGLAALLEDARAGGCTEPVPLRVVRELVGDRLTGERRTGAFLREGITFCEMLPMRAIPARVVALVGLSDDQFPRGETRLGFDLVARHPRRGDRSKRDDDRYLVLEALLSARDALIVTYVSRSVQDNKPRPPSVVLADLLDAVDRTFLPPPEGGAPRDRFVVHHPLQPFSPRYVAPVEAGGRVLRTWDPQAASGAAALVRGTAAPPPFLSAPLPASGAPETVDLAELHHFLQDPCLWFLKRRLRVGSVEELDPLPEREPLELDPLDEYQVGERLLVLRRRGLDWDTCRAVLDGEGRLPLGHLANPALARVARRVDGILHAARARLSEPQRPPLRFEIPLGRFRLTGRLDGLYAGARVELGYAGVSRRGGRHRLALWLRHLALQAVAAEHGDLPRNSELYGRDGDDTGLLLGFGPVDAHDARAALEALVEVWLGGRDAPAPFLPDAGWAWWQEASTGGRSDEALRKARRAAAEFWQFRDQSRAAWERLLGGEAAFQRSAERPGEACAFEEIAERVFLPLSRLGVPPARHGGAP